MEMGENVQINHMTVTKYVYANCYSNAKSSTAARFLKEHGSTTHIDYIMD
jgi:hypothetical protein